MIMNYLLWHCLGVEIILANICLINVIYAIVNSILRGVIMVEISQRCTRTGTRVCQFLLKPINIWRKQEGCLVSSARECLNSFIINIIYHCKFKIDDMFE